MLTRDTVSTASKIMLPTYVLVATYIGLCYLLSPPERLQGPSLTVARAMLPMHVWGAMALLLAVALVAAMLTRRRQVAICALCMGAAAYLAWSMFYAAAIFRVPDASFVSPVWPFIAVVAQIATAVSLTRDELK